MAGIGPTPMRLSQGTGSHLDFRRKKKRRGGWLVLSMILLAGMLVGLGARLAVLDPDRPVQAQAMTPDQPRVITLN